MHKLSCENEFYLHENETSFQYQRLSTFFKFNFIYYFSLLTNKYTEHKLTIIGCQSQRLIWRRSESYNVLLSYNENKN